MNLDRTWTTWTLAEKNAVFWFHALKKRRFFVDWEKKRPFFVNAKNRVFSLRPKNARFFLAI